ncbi:MAG: BlaI/MecI/CopY family transcriptional regulator [Muribaculaceae bacterium]|nr:BlaI/MecI/CopY family transcriptional regulator [Muribaculaceae bacterium]
MKRTHKKEKVNEDKNWTQEEIAITAKEEEIMRLLWEGGKMSVKEMLDRMPEPKPHVNTVSTFVRQLEAKGYVGHEAAGMGYRYFAILPKKNFSRKTLGEVVKNYFNNNMLSMVSALVDDEELTVEQLKELIEIIEKK